MQIEISDLIEKLTTLKHDGTHFLSDEELEGLCDSMWVGDKPIDRYCDECGDTAAYEVFGEHVCSSCGQRISPEAPAEQTLAADPKDAGEN